MCASNFKELLDKDLETTIYNTKEFAEKHTIKYGDFEIQIPILFDLQKQKERKLTAKDNAEGIHIETEVIRLKLSDIKRIPRQGARFWIDNEMYIVSASTLEYNEVIIDLERFDE